MPDQGQLSGGIAQLNAKVNHPFPPTILTALGSTQGGAAAIPTDPQVGSVIRVAGATSALGVILPPSLAWMSAGGGPIVVIPAPTVGVKVYPASGEGLKAAATNTAIVIASAKATTFYPVGNAVGASTAYRWALSA